MSELAEEIVVIGRGQTDVGVAGADQTELERIDAKFGLEREAALQSRAHIFTG